MLGMNFGENWRFVNIQFSFNFLVEDFDPRFFNIAIVFAVSAHIVVQIRH